MFALFEGLLVKQAEWVIPIVAEWRDAHEARPLIQANGCMLVDTRFQPKQANPLGARIARQVLQYHLGEA